MKNDLSDIDIIGLISILLKNVAINHTYVTYDQACDSVRAEIEREILVAGRRLVTKCVAKVPSKKVSLAKYVR